MNAKLVKSNISLVVTTAIFTAVPLILSMTLLNLEPPKKEQIVAEIAAENQIQQVIETPVIQKLNIKDVNYNQRNLECLALNVYHEAKNQPLHGQFAVALVTLNRVNSVIFPNTICKVVKQRKKVFRGTRIVYVCQFSWFCDGKSDRVVNGKAWAAAFWVSETILKLYKDNRDDITQGAMWYHATYAKPKWRHSFEQVAQIGDHIFYKN